MWLSTSDQVTNINTHIYKKDACSPLMYIITDVHIGDGLNIEHLQVEYAHFLYSCATQGYTGAQLSLPYY